MLQLLQQILSDAKKQIIIKNKKETLLGNYIINKIYPNKQLVNFIKINGIGQNFITKIYCLLNNIKQLPTCKICNKQITKIKNFIIGFSQTCSNKCTCLLKYGVISTACLPEIQFKMKQTILKNNNGIGFSSKNIKEKATNTMIQKFGCIFSKTQQFKRKCIETNLKRYNAQHFMKTIQGKQTLKQSILKKYNVQSFMKTQQGKLIAKQNYNINRFLSGRKIAYFNRMLQLLNNKFIPLFNIQQFHGIKQKYLFKCTNCNTIFLSSLTNLLARNTLTCPKCKKFVRSLIQHKIKIELENLFNIKFKEDYILKNNKEIDIFNKFYNFAFEYNGNYWHSDKILINAQINHINKYNYLKENNINLFAIWSDQFQKYKNYIYLLISQILKINKNLKEKQFIFFTKIYKFEKIKIFNNIAIKYMETKKSIIINDISIIEFNKNQLQQMHILLKQFNKQIYLFVENRLLSFYLIFFNNIQFLKTKQPKFYLFNNKRSIETYKKYSSKINKIWNYRIFII